MKAIGMDRLSSGTNMLKVFTKDATGKIFEGGQITAKAAETFSDEIHAMRVASAEKIKIKASLVASLKHIFLNPDATIAEAEQIFDKMA